MTKPKEEDIGNYNVNVRKAKANGICRECKKKILIGSIVLRTSVSDGYKIQSMMLHSECALTKLIKEITKIEENHLKEKISKFKEIGKLLK